MDARSTYVSRPAGAEPVLHLGELVGSLSAALDMTEGQPEGHCVRSCYIGVRIGEALGLDDEAMDTLYYTILLKDLGCSSNAARICELYLADDIDFKRDFKLIDDSLPAALRFVLDKTGRGANVARRVAAIANIMRNGREIVDGLIETRCHRGATIAAQLGFSAAVQAGILSLDEHLNGHGRAGGLRGDEVPLASSVALMAQVADVFFMHSGEAVACAEILHRRGTWFDPRLVDAFLDAQSDPSFWATLGDPSVQQTVFAMPMARRVDAVDEDRLDRIVAGFADVIDAKSIFTAEHSRRVTLYADMIAQELGLGDAHRRWIGRAALLHDLGKLGVSNRILDKPGKLDADEWAAIRRHPDGSRRLLSGVTAFTDIAPVAGAHHERPDGKGYPDGLKGDAVCMESRILACADVFDALSAARPYRAAMPMDEVFAILDKDTGTAFDPHCVAALKRACAHAGDLLAA